MNGVFVGVCHSSELSLCVLSWHKVQISTQQHKYNFLLWIPPWVLIACHPPLSSAFPRSVHSKSKIIEVLKKQHFPPFCLPSLLPSSQTVRYWRRFACWLGINPTVLSTQRSFVVTSWPLATWPVKTPQWTPATGPKTWPIRLAGRRDWRCFVWDIVSCYVPYKVASAWRGFGNGTLKY